MWTAVARGAGSGSDCGRGDAEAVLASKREVALGALQPSQLYVSEEKLAAVTSEGAKPGETLPVKDLCGRLVLTDGHTRALAAHLGGEATVSVI